MEGGRPMSPSGAGEARSGSSATWAVAGGPCRGQAPEVDGIEAWQVYDAELRRAKRAGSVSERRREGCLALTAHVRSTLPEARVAASAMVRPPGTAGCGSRWCEARRRRGWGEPCVWRDVSAQEGVEN